MTEFWDPNSKWSQMHISIVRFGTLRKLKRSQTTTETLTSIVVTCNFWSTFTLIFIYILILVNYSAIKKGLNTNKKLRAPSMNNLLPFPIHSFWKRFRSMEHWPPKGKIPFSLRVWCQDGIWDDAVTFDLASFVRKMVSTSLRRLSKSIA